jgi:hypothetical protein
MQDIFVAIAIVLAIIFGTVATSQSNASDTQITTAEGPRYQ